jgi:phospholipid transport system substrate-binding protein
MNTRNLIAFFFLLIFSIPVLAQPAAIPMLQSTADQMSAALQKNQAVLKTKPDVVYGIIRTILLPHVDTANMARTVLGRDAWINATPAQQQRFTQEFTTLLVRTYSAAFASYTNESVKFLPPRGGIAADQSRVQIESQIIRNGGPAISVNYRLALQSNEWKIYDFSVEGISMVESFHSQFAAQLSQGNLDALINQLAQRNVRPQKLDAQ